MAEEKELTEETFLQKVMGKKPQTPKTMIAKKNFEIHHNDYHCVIKEGDDLSQIPELYHANLKTEGVI